MLVELEDVPALVEEIRASKVAALDLETTSLDSRRDQTRLMSLATARRARGVWFVDLFESAPTPVLEALKRNTLFIHNAAFDLGFSDQLGYEHEGELIDTMLLTQLLYAEAAVPPLKKGRSSHALDTVAERELDTTLVKA